MSNEINACGIKEHRAKSDFFGEEINPKAYEHAEKIGLSPRPKETISEIGNHGEFVRQANSFITPFGDKEGQLKAESNRYAIYWGHGCHWSNRPVIVRDILGLEDVIADVAVKSGGIYGHGFSDQKDSKDPLTGVYFLSEFYSLPFSISLSFRIKTFYPDCKCFLPFYLGNYKPTSKSQY